MDTIYTAVAVEGGTNIFPSPIPLNNVLYQNDAMKQYQWECFHEFKWKLKLQTWTGQGRSLWAFE